MITEEDWQDETPARLPLVTRVEVHSSVPAMIHNDDLDDHCIIDRRKQADLDVSISFQDDGRTMKVFVKRKEAAS